MGDTKSDVTANSTEESQEGTEEQTAQTDSQTEGSKPEGDEESSEESDESNESDEDEGDEDDNLPEWARKKISKVNREAKNLRDQLRQVQEKLQGAKTPEEVAAITQELTETNSSLTLELARERALRKHGLDEDDAVLLTASTPEDIDKQAERIASRIGGGGRGPLKGGLDPMDDDDVPSDPGELAKRYGRRRY